MKVNQIVSEHKKGFRAKKYAMKPKNTIAPKKPEPIKPQGPVGTDVKVKETQTVSNVNPTTGTEVTDDQTKVKTIIPPEAQAALMPDPNKPGELDLNTAALSTSSTSTATTNPNTPKVGAKVNAIAPVKESADDALLEKMRVIAGLR